MEAGHRAGTLRRVHSRLAPQGRTWGFTGSGMGFVTAVTEISAPELPVIPVTAVTDDVEQAAVPRPAASDVDTCSVQLGGEARQLF